ncbi:6-phosphogluconolactonase [Nocardioides sp. LHG3406-4]|uniref:6-phosphogluconolactonase n=1 Tax=Nocardioides sp. LHG3406-4 TaxID=2804575 RepID=UPI003CFB3C24
MTEPEVVVHDDAGTLAGDVASRLLEVLELAQADGRVPQIGLTGGSIADAVHREVARRAVDSSVDWTRVVLWWGDERFVPAGSSERNATGARQALLDGLPLDPAHVHEMPAADGGLDLDGAAAAYADDLRTHGSGAFDVLMLGVGPDGHCASLFPGHPALDVDDQVAVGVRESPKPPPERISLTFAALNRSRAVWFVVSGEEKAAAVASALSGADVHQTPAAGVQGQDETLWLLDADAASQL